VPPQDVFPRRHHCKGEPEAPTEQCRSGLSARRSVRADAAGSCASAQGYNLLVAFGSLMR